MYRVHITADFEGPEQAILAYHAMSEAVGKNDGDEQHYDIEWIGLGQESFPQASLWESLLDLDVGMGRVTAWQELTESDGLSDEEAAWVIQVLDIRMVGNEKAMAVWNTGECEADDLVWRDSDPEAPIRHALSRVWHRAFAAGAEVKATGGTDEEADEAAAAAIGTTPGIARRISMLDWEPNPDAHHNH